METIEAFRAKLQNLSVSRTTLISNIAAGIIIYFVFRSSLQWYRRRKLYKKRDQKLKQTTSKKLHLKQKLQGLHTPVENSSSITQLGTEELYEKLTSGQLKAVDVLEAYQVKALEADEVTNCITEIVYDADVAAIVKDLECQSKNHPILFGIPMSIKEHLEMTGYDATVGSPALLSGASEEDCVVVKVLKNHGAIPFARTNMPQYGMSFDCVNALYGETLNPHDKTRGPGGSSGGEGALIGGGGSLLGIGTDIGGSIRIPAAFCGIYGFKPTAARMTVKGMFDTSNSPIKVSTGPMCRDFAGIIRVMRALFSETMFSLDSYIPPLQFNESEYSNKKPLKIGYYLDLSTIDNTIMKSTPAVQRAVMVAKAALESAGHTLVPWTPPRPLHAYTIALRSYFHDGGKEYCDMLRRDIVPPEYKETAFLMKLPFFVKKLLYYLVNPITPLSAHLLESLRSGGTDGVNVYARCCEDMEKYHEEFNKSWHETGLDALICPVMPFTAIPLQDVKYVLPGVLYTSIYNTLDYPAGVVPVTKVNKEDVQRLADSYNTNDWLLTKIVKEAQRSSEALPVCVQVVAMRWRDEVCLRAMRELSVALSS